MEVCLCASAEPLQCDRASMLIGLTYARVHLLIVCMQSHIYVCLFTAARTVHRGAPRA